MKYFLYVFILFLLLTINNVIIAQSFINNSPKNNSSLVSLGTNIILRCDKAVDPASLNTNEFIVSGSKSGSHAGTVRSADNNLTILFLPDAPFAADEMVTVTIGPGIRTPQGKDFPLLSLHFKTTKLQQIINSNSSAQIEETSLLQSTAQGYNGAINKTSATDSVPSNFPTITIGTNNNPSDGKLFIANQPSGAANKAIGNYLMILNNDGSPVKYKNISVASNLFKMEPDGQLSFNPKGNGARILMDTAFTQLDTFKCGNGYSTDGHDFLLLPNGHALVFANDPEPIDMSQIVPGGNPNAVVTGVIIQELDALHNVVFQWRSWDYLDITDSYFDLTSASVDLIHANAITVDLDGNILFSMRHFSSIIKVNRNTGNVDWILGGKKNQFTFVNENEANRPTYFSYQHDISVLPNGNITLFDNGNQHPDNYSRGVEYQLDTLAMTATMVWEYRHNPDVYSSAMGSVQRLPNGNTLIGWGMMSLSTSPVMTEVHPDKSVALELFLPSGQISYRSLKYPWNSASTHAQVQVNEILQGNTYTFSNTTDTTGIKIKYTTLNSGLYTNAVVNRFNFAPVNPVFSDNVPNLVSNYFTIASPGTTSYTGEIHVALNQFPAISNPKTTIVYGMPLNGGTFMPQPTSYDSAKGELVFTTSLLGQFVFGIPQAVSSLAPSIVSPKNNEIVNGKEAIHLRWGTRGVTQSYHLQIATDSIFSNIVVDNTNLVSSSFLCSVLSNNSTYFWRVNNTNSAGVSAWSQVSRFLTASPFITIVSPNGGDKMFPDSTYVIRWITNIADTVNITLYRANKVALVIADSVTAATCAYAWSIPSNFASDTTFRVQISDIRNSTLTALSAANFSIGSIINGVKIANPAIKDYALLQNYPNPFNPSTVIRYIIPADGQVNIDVFNIIGQKIASLENSVKKAGEYDIQWNAGSLPSGLYFYTINATNAAGKRFTMTRKMLLLK
jgi:hypothetical protein